MVDQSVVGRVAPSFEMIVERGKVAEFARATGSQHPEYLDAACPVAPATFLVTAGFWTDPGSNPLFLAGIEFSRLLHGGQQFEFFGPPPTAGTTLTCTSHVESMSTKEGKAGVMTFVDIVSDFVEADGRLAARSRATVIEMPDS